MVRGRKPDTIQIERGQKQGRTDQLVAGERGAFHSSMTMLRRPGQHMHEFMRYYPAQRASHQLIRVGEVTTPHRASDQAGDSRTIHFPKGLDPAVYHSGDCQRA